jgi:putative ABC transport system permease protein
MLFDLLKTSFRSLMSNKTRTFLTMLGIIIGVFAVISLISIGQGIQNYVTGQFGKLGSNLIFVTPGKLNLRGDPGANFNANKLDEKHLRLIENYASDYVINVTPILEIGKTVSYKNKTYYTELQATNELGNITYSVEIETGKYFSRSDVNSNSRVAVLGATAALELFPNQDPIGKNVKVDDKSFEVIGVAKEKGSSLDRRVFIPYTTAKHIFNIDKFSAIVMTSKFNDNVDTAMKRVEIAILRDLKEDQFTVISQKDLLSSFQNILSTITIGIGAIAAISLLVGGIGIMNIMLVTVTERTSEIGLRKAVGATPNNIATQFLVEAMSLSVLGGLIGMTLGILLALIVRTYFNFDAEVPSWSIFLAFGFSVMIGVIFGTYPAIKAAKKDPIEALRYE